MNKKQLYNLIEIEKEMQEQFQKLVPKIYAKAEQIFNFRKIGNNWCNFPKDYSQLDNTGDNSECISINKETITIYWTEYHCQSEDYFNISFPASYLFMTDKEWQGIEIIETYKRKKRIEEEKKKRALEEKERQREANIKEFKRLKKKLNK